MDNYQQPGDVLELTAPAGGVVSGGIYKIGQMIVVAAFDAAAGVAFSAQLVGVFSITKVGSQAWTVGALVYWDDGNTYFTTTASGNQLAGAAVAAVGSGAGETTGIVRLNGIASLDIP
ncbi:MAG: DUF2190 family protein [bacterium]|nr:DUF2190 family protein [bacterium]